MSNIGLHYRITEPDFFIDNNQRKKILAIGKSIKKSISGKLLNVIVLISYGPLDKDVTATCLSPELKSAQLISNLKSNYKCSPILRISARFLYERDEHQPSFGKIEDFS